MTESTSMTALAGRLEKAAGAMAFIYLSLWAMGGTVPGAALGACSLIAGVIAWSAAQGRKASLRPQAIRARSVRH